MLARASSVERATKVAAYRGQQEGFRISPEGNVWVVAEQGSSRLYFWRAPSWEEIVKVEAAEQSKPTAAP